jgi:hypothetical protein
MPAAAVCARRPMKMAPACAEASWREDTLAREGRRREVHRLPGSLRDLGAGGPAKLNRERLTQIPQLRFSTTVRMRTNIFRSATLDSLELGDWSCLIKAAKKGFLEGGAHGDRR